jgi:hypothetical protein
MTTKGRRACFFATPFLPPPAAFAFAYSLLISFALLRPPMSSLSTMLSALLRACWSFFSTRRRLRAFASATCATQHSSNAVLHFFIN